MRIKLVVITACVCIFVTCFCSFMINAAEVGNPFMRGSGDIIQTIKQNQHEEMDAFDVEYETFDGEW